MFGKLLKYEWKASSRIILPVCLLSIVLSILNGWGIRAPEAENLWMDGSGFTMVGVLKMMVMTLDVLLMVALLIMVTVICIMRFYRTVVGSEGRLMMTVPVAAWKIPASRALVGFALSIIVSITLVLNIVTLIGPTEIVVYLRSQDFSKLLEVLRDLHQTVGWGAMLLLYVQLVLSMIIGFFAGMYTFYLAIMLGQMSNNHKVAMSFVWYLVIYVVQYVVNSMLVVNLSFFSFLDSNIDDLQSFVANINPLLGYMLATNTVFLFVSAWLINYLMKKRLNV